MATKPSPRSSIRIARIYGIDVRMHWSFLALVLFVVWAEWASGLEQVGVWLLWIAAVFGSVLVHEFAHCVVARRRGAVVEDVLLLPIGGVSQMEKIPEAPDDELAIAVVGPLTSLGLGLLAAAGGLAFGAHMWPPTLFAGSWLAAPGVAELRSGGLQPGSCAADGRREDPACGSIATPRPQRGDSPRGQGGQVPGGRDDRGGSSLRLLVRPDRFVRMAGGCRRRAGCADLGARSPGRPWPIYDVAAALGAGSSYPAMTTPRPMHSDRQRGSRGRTLVVQT